MMHKSVQRNYNSIDLFKFIMALCVVAIHTNPFVNCTNSLFLSFYNLVVELAVPFFFLASGYLLGKKIMNANAVQSDLAATRKQLFKILKMYLLWSAIYLPLAVYGYWAEGSSFAGAVVRYIRGLVLVGENYNSWQLWYLLSTVYALVVVLILLRMGIRNKYLPVVALAATLVSVGFDALVQSGDSLPGVFLLLKKLVSLTIANGRILRGMIYIPVGIWIAHKDLSAKWCAVIFGLGFAANLFVENAVISSFLGIVTAVAFFGAVLGIKLKAHPVYAVLRNISTKTYLIHMYVWTFYYLAVYGRKEFGIDSFIITAVLCVIISCVALYFKKRASRGEQEKGHTAV